MPKKIKTKMIKPIEDIGINTNLQFEVMKEVMKEKKIKEKDVFNNYKKPEKEKSKKPKKEKSKKYKKK
jgi:hypothetical protein